MKKQLLKPITALGMITCMMIPTQLTGYGALTYETENSVCYVTENKYYNEVSTMAETISESLPEAEREYMYDACMVSVFGVNYRKSAGQYFADLICVMTSDEVNSMQQGLLSNLVYSGSVRYNDDRWEIRAVNPIALNAEGVNEDNYQGLKLLYATFLEAKEKLTDLDEAAKIRALHDLIIEKLDAPAVGVETTERMHSMTAALTDHLGACNVYSSLFYILGTANGLTVKIDHDHVKHDCNYVFINGKWLSMDVMYDDTSNSTKAYLTEECIWKSQHKNIS